VRDRQLRYKALTDITVGGRLLAVRGTTFTTGQQFGEALAREGKVEALAVLEQPALPKGRHHRRDMRAKGDDK